MTKLSKKQLEKVSELLVETRGQYKMGCIVRVYYKSELLGAKDKREFYPKKYHKFNRHICHSVVEIRFKFKSDILKTNYTVYEYKY